jgi:hypothetical protein
MNNKIPERTNIAVFISFVIINILDFDALQI